jgi:citronellyl-CoA dehydrogenase
MIFSDEHLQLQQSFSKFIAREVNPHVAEWEAAGMFPAHELFRQLGKQSLLGINKATAFGGLGLDYTFQAAFCETLGEIECGSLPMAIGVQTDMATPALAKYGSDELRAEFLTPSISGEYVACLGVSETGAGSDVATIATTARRDGDDYVIDGGKMWTTNGYQADWMCLLANTSDGPMHYNKSLLCVPMKAPGVSTSQKLDKVGMRSSDTVQVFFDGVRVPQRYRIGEEGYGFVYQMEQFQEERLCGAIGILRGMDRAIAQTIDYTRARVAFGRPILDNQVVHFRLAELHTEVELLRSLIYRAVEEYAAGANVTRFASMAKLKAGRLAREVADACVQYFGGMGFMNETPITRFWRDSRLISIGGGTDEIMLGIIAKEMNILPRRQGVPKATLPKTEAGAAAVPAGAGRA